MIEKKYSPKGRSCRVTFTASAGMAEKAIAVVGDFNDWDYSAHPMKPAKNGSGWQTTIALKPGQTHSFKYLSDLGWFTDEAADQDEEKNSVLEL